MKSKLKPDWIPKWQQNWDKNNLHKVNGKMIPKPLPAVTYPPGQTNHMRHQSRQLYRKQVQLMKEEARAKESS